MGRLENKVAIVTAGGSGIGRAISHRFAREGAAVVIANRTPAKGEFVADEIAQYDGRAVAIATDVAEPEQIRQLVEQTVARHGRIDVLVNNAGIGKDATGPFWEISVEAFDETMAVNVRAMFVAAKYAYPHMPDGASIVNMGSVASLVAYPNEVPYISSKGAVLQMTRALAVDCAPRHIRVNCICPGSTMTPGMQHWLDIADDQPALLRQFSSNALLDRMGHPDEIAAAALFLASSESSFMTGTALVVDGGWTAGRRSGVFLASD